MRAKLEQPAAGKRAALHIYNGVFLDAAQPLQWDLADPLALKVGYAKPKAEKMDRTVLRFELPGQSVSVAVEDVVAHGCIYIPSAGLFVTVDPPPMTLAQYRQQIAGRQTVLEQVRQRPDRTMADALAKTRNPVQSLGPTLLSLACDNRKFIVSREGVIRFDLYGEPDCEYPFYQFFDAKTVCPQLLPQFGSGNGQWTRRLEHDWLPKQVSTMTENGISYRQLTYVAPIDEQAPADRPDWWRQRAVCVADYTIENTSGKEADAAFNSCC